MVLAQRAYIIRHFVKGSTDLHKGAYQSAHLVADGFHVCALQCSMKPVSIGILVHTYRSTSNYSQSHCHLQSASVTVNMQSVNSFDTGRQADPALNGALALFSFPATSICMLPSLLYEKENMYSCSHTCLKAACGKECNLPEVG